MSENEPLENKPQEKEWHDRLRNLKKWWKDAPFVQALAIILLATILYNLTLVGYALFIR